MSPSAAPRRLRSRSRGPRRRRGGAAAGLSAATGYGNTRTAAVGGLAGRGRRRRCTRRAGSFTMAGSSGAVFPFPTGRTRWGVHRRLSGRQPALACRPRIACRWLIRRWGRRGRRAPGHRTRRTCRVRAFRLSATRHTRTARGTSGTLISARHPTVVRWRGQRPTTIDRHRVGAPCRTRASRGSRALDRRRVARWSAAHDCSVVRTLRGLARSARVTAASRQRRTGGFGCRGRLRAASLEDGPVGWLAAGRDVTA
jgi:hypothetical protein